MRIIRILSGAAIWAAAISLALLTAALFILSQIGGSGAGMVGYGLFLYGGIYLVPASAVLLMVGLIGKLITGRAP